jgi:hypothetical protein
MVKRFIKGLLRMGRREVRVSGDEHYGQVRRKEEESIDIDESKFKTGGGMN